MGIYYSLNKPIDCKRLCSEVGKYIEKFKVENSEQISDCVLSINIHTTTTTTDHIPKLENNEGK